MTNTMSQINRQADNLPPFPPTMALETINVLKAQSKASRALAELKGVAQSIPNPAILLDTLTLQEALASSAIENIVTTQDALYQTATLADDKNASREAKDVKLNSIALLQGYDHLKAHGNLTVAMMEGMFRTIKQMEGGLRHRGVKIVGKRGNEEWVVHTPPQDPRTVKRLMSELEAYINEHEAYDLDPLIRMALIHHQFESIHPFIDGNGRIGRIINALYLTKEGLLDTPILYLSRSINNTRARYYMQLQEVRNSENWENWIVYMLECVYTAATSTLKLILEIRALMADFKKAFRSKQLKDIYSHKLLNHLFMRPYTLSKHLQESLDISYGRANRILNRVAAQGLVKKMKVGRVNYFVNKDLLDLFTESHHNDQEPRVHWVHD